LHLLKGQGINRENYSLEGGIVERKILSEERKKERIWITRGMRKVNTEGRGEERRRWNREMIKAWRTRKKRDRETVKWERRRKRRKKGMEGLVKKGELKVEERKGEKKGKGGGGWLERQDEKEEKTN
jgi:hypothetical protein